MAKKRFIAAFSPDAGEVAAEVPPSSSAGSIRRCRSRNPPAGALNAVLSTSIKDSNTGTGEKSTPDDAENNEGPVGARSE